MALITQSLPTLLRGVSRSSESQKQSDHALSQSNLISSPTEGLKKRSGTQFIAKLQSSAMGNVHMQTINRDTNEKYLSVFSSSSVKVFDIQTGTPKSVETPDGISYLNVTSPRDELKTVSVADYTFVINTTKTVEMTTDITSTPHNGALIFFNQVSDNTEYHITVDNTTAMHNTASDNPLSTTLICTKIRNKLLGLSGESPDVGSVLSGFQIDHIGPVLYVRKTDNSTFDIGSTDTQGNSQITLIKDSIQKFTDLPTVAVNDYIVEVKGNDSTNFDNYYVKFATDNGSGGMGRGQWAETAKPGITYKYDYSTMPHVLVRQSDGHFIFAQADGASYAEYTHTGTYTQANFTCTVTSANHGFSTGDVLDLKFTSGNAVDAIKTITVTDANTFNFSVSDGNFSVNMAVTFGRAHAYVLPKWGERAVGDLDTAPNSSFVGTKINNVFFFRNRLGFLSEDNVILSRVGEYFNFFPETVTTVLDSDPIDVSASNTKVSILKHAITMGEELIIFSEETQFIFSSSSDSLTPKTANILVSTEFTSNAKANPVSVGNSIYFLTKKGDSHSGVKEYITQPGINIKDASDITLHIPMYIPSNIQKLTASSNENFLVLLPAGSGTLYVNNWLYGENNQKVLNAWYDFEMGYGETVLNIDFIGSDLYMVISNTAETNLFKLPFESKKREPNAEGIDLHRHCEFHLDNKVTEATTGVSITYANGTSTFTFPYKLAYTPKIVGSFTASNATSTYVDKDGNTKTLQPGQSITTSTVNQSFTTSTVTATGDYRNSKVTMGLEFGIAYTLPKQKLIDKQTNSQNLTGRFQMLHFYLKYESTASFEVWVSPDGSAYSDQARSRNIYKFTPNVLGTTVETYGVGGAGAPLSNLRLQTGVFKFPVMSKADRVDITIMDDTFMPLHFVSAEYEARYHSRARRI
tara:strand:- start:216 stop:2978 length:2763 start_codon:yes stop_codon:yes gene_type:complete